jgi:hypothetical protein
MSIANGSPPPDTNHAPMFLGVTGVFTLLSIGLCGVRIWTRIKPEAKFRSDDYLILVGTVGVPSWLVHVLPTLTDTLGLVHSKLFPVNWLFGAWVGPSLGICCKRRLGARLQVEFCSTSFVDPRNFASAAVHRIVPSTIESKQSMEVDPMDYHWPPDHHLLGPHVIPVFQLYTPPCKLGTCV